jgi:hypothetical protein
MAYPSISSFIREVPDLLETIGVHFSLSNSLCFKALVETTITSKEVPSKSPTLLNLAEIVA